MPRILPGRVDRLDEIEAVRRRVEAERGAVARFQRLAHILRLPLAAADQREAADHRAHLVVEEAARRGLDVDLLADAADVEPVERLDRAVRLAMGRAEGGEVVAADEHAPRLRCIASTSSGTATCQTRPASSAGGARRLRMR